ncbi:uncharacterized protein LOC134765052 [Penaeus indicus]|uniref:uncharacterized protein LOC134765052 n=1 Tax=Penaeus indicus TaxID=29960 RepID=UPI00300C6D11
MERPHGGNSKDDTVDIKQEKGTSGGAVPSCGSSSGPTSIASTNPGGEVEEKMEVDKPLLLPSLPSLPSTSSVTITKASTAALQKSSQNPVSSSSSSSSSSSVSSLSSTTSSSASSSLPFSSSLSSAVSTLTSVTLSAVSSSAPSSTPSSEAASTLSSSKVGPDMMPTIPLVPVQVPNGRSGVVTIPKNRGRSKGMPLCPSRSGGFQNRKGLKIKRLGIRGRGGRRLVHSMSLEERGDDSPLPLDDEAYAQDDMFIAPLYQDKWPGRMCGLCCLSEQSQLGQGELIRHDPTPGYILPEKIPSPMEPEEDSPLSKKFKPNISLFKDKGKSPRKQVGEALPEPVDEISLVGHQEPPSISILFESTGHCYVHYMCALWSSDVELASDDTISCIDRAVVTGASQRCVHCKKFGATIPCKEVIKWVGSCWAFDPSVKKSRFLRRAFCDTLDVCLPCREGMCGLCCLSEQSQLGQGELIRHDPTPGYILPEKIPSPMEPEEDSPLSKKFKPNISLFKDKGKSPRKQVERHYRNQWTRYPWWVIRSRQVYPSFLNLQAIAMFTTCVLSGRLM